MTETQLATPAIKPFVMAGNATFTAVSNVTGNRFTYRVVAPKQDRDGNPTGKDAATVRFVSVLTGPQNTNDYTFIGTVFVREQKFLPSKKSRISADSPSVKAFAWFAAHVVNGSRADACTVYHAGRCGRCNRLLTTPASITQGIGPECAKHV